MDSGRERFWQSQWRSEGLATARRSPGREKFFALVAYPGSSGFLHIGHLRGLILADALHRYHRMRGHAVFFPTGTHATGLPAVTFAQKVRDRDPDTVELLATHGVGPSELPALEDPPAAARFLGQDYLRQFRRLGLLLDESAYVTTIDDDYQAFIRWQFHRLADRGALRQGAHYAPFCPVCGPVSVDPSETDLAKGGSAEVVVFTLVPFTLDDGRVLLAATLRPETLYGVTNIWIPAETPLTVWHHGTREYLVVRSAAERLVEQHGGRIGHDVPVPPLEGLTASAPLTKERVPVLRSSLVDPGIGTGVVMSVPAHAPADWLAIQGLPEGERRRIPEPRVIIEFPPVEELVPSDRSLLEGDGPPAARAVRATGARALTDTEALEAATQRLYRLEFLRGKMRSDLLDGLFVAPARARIARDLVEAGGPGELREFSEAVVCRNGHAVIVRKVPGQWFLRYGEETWKEETRAAFRGMTIFPPEYAAEIPSILDWYDDRPCTRQGRWLGTPFPPDPSWIIEPIADSTFYPAYFVVRRYVADGRVPIAALTDAFFDRVFLGEGPGEPSLPAAVQTEVADEFRYWYPLDLNIGGKEHKRVHFPLFVYTHAKLLPPALRPKGIFVHWWLTDKGGAKLSKKKVGKGGAIPPMDEALGQWGVDALRLFYALAASPQQDIEWDPVVVDAASDRLREIERTIQAIERSGGGGPLELDRWLEDRCHQLAIALQTAYDALALREAAEIAYVQAPAILRRYLARGGSPGPALDAFVGAWIRWMQPLTPHLAEELGAGRFEGLVARAAFPSPEEFRPSPTADAEERYLDSVEEDLRSVLKPAVERGEAPGAVAFFIAAPWKRTLEQWMREAERRTPGGPPPIRELVERARAHPELAAHVPEVAAYVGRVFPMLRQERSEAAALDERAVLVAGEGYLARRLGFERVLVLPEGEAEAHDPQGRRARARPGRPAFFLSGRRPASST
ncbi:MAG TPA: class I tRNA ligase family protein [Thermoplasmata archaeon]|nr:class I tRNA ligase family protein [Thermoplasmata archaeon]